MTDEAQDLNPFLLFALRAVSQRFFAHTGFDQWDEVEKEVFGDQNPEWMALNISYCSTFEIVQMANTKYWKTPQHPYKQ
ncbi:hypothetical protein ACFO25_06440 [Paenactinomyces guangxiensis]|uniref:Uncharacterized protein n=1 Tax=Paenactinomyces guangxiensis TaxID=1490290 RepID=A0A7W2A7N7_9BACL|nr:hypothetical protein [Paenactinomyces guangxiensis]MBA4493307.1 hypothetical protein [Paenactinomyces guangxiensis]MBH8589842.1 hypothetical protein [Paenactinomyces guangxiensis]